MESRYIKIGPAAKRLGTTPPVLREWHARGERIPARITRGGTRYYDLHDLLPHQAPSTLTLGYARVSSADPPDDRCRPQAMREAYGAHQGWQTEIITDLGSDLNYPQPVLQRRWDLIRPRGIARLGLTPLTVCYVSGLS